MILTAAGGGSNNITSDVSTENCYAAGDMNEKKRELVQECNHSLHTNRATKCFFRVRCTDIVLKSLLSLMSITTNTNKLSLTAYFYAFYTTVLSSTSKVIFHYKNPQGTVSRQKFSGLRNRLQYSPCLSVRLSVPRFVSLCTVS